jgi:regulatory protein
MPLRAPRRITSLDPDPAKPGQVRVLVNGQLYCTLPVDRVGSVGLEVGATLDPGLAEKAGRVADEEATYRTLLRALERRSFACDDLRRRMIAKGHPAEAVDPALARAQAAGLLDDVAYAAQFVRSRAERGRGPVRVRRDLRALGIAAEVIERALVTDWPEEHAPDLLAERMARLRAGQLRGVPRLARFRRVVAYLARRGFTGSQVMAMVRGVVGGVGE